MLQDFSRERNIGCLDERIVFVSFSQVFLLLFWGGGDQSRLNTEYLRCLRRETIGEHADSWRSVSSVGLGREKSNK
jgi:hypothetical protein